MTPRTIQAKVSCPFCDAGESRVLPTRLAQRATGYRRLRLCSACGKRFETLEIAQPIRKTQDVAHLSSSSAV